MDMKIWRVCQSLNFRSKQKAPTRKGLGGVPGTRLRTEAMFHGQKRHLRWRDSYTQKNYGENGLTSIAD